MMPKENIGADELRDTGGKGVAEAVKKVQEILARLEADQLETLRVAKQVHEDAHAARVAAEEVKTLKLQDRARQTGFIAAFVWLKKCIFYAAEEVKQIRID